MQPIKILLCLIVIALFFGCVVQKDVTTAKKEVLLNTEQIDIDDDGLWDYTIYTFAPVKAESEGLVLQRMLFVAAEHTVTYSSFNEMSDYTIANVVEEYNDFVTAESAAEKKCSSSLGLVGMICVEPKSCAKLCASSSSKCNNFVSMDETVVGDSIKSLTKSTSEIENEMTQVQNVLSNLKTASKEDKIELANMFSRISYQVASVNTALVIANPTTVLCQHDGYGTKKLNSIINMIGIPEKSKVRYSYLSLVSIRAADTKTKDWQSKTLLVDDNIPKTGITADDISSPQLDPQSKKLSIKSSGSNILLAWESMDPYSTGESWLVYGFSSESEPTVFIESMNSPSIKIKAFDLTAALPTMMLFDVISSITNKPVFALGFAISMTLIFIGVVYNIITISFYILTALFAKETMSTGIRRAVAKTHLQWKGDLILSLLLLIGGFAASFYLAPGLKPGITMFEMFEYLLRATEYVSIAGSLGTLFGFFMFYLAIENKVKVSFLEVEYGRKIKEEGDIFLANISQLKTKLEELKTTADALSAEGVSVSREYELVENYPLERVESLSKKMDQYSKQTIEQALFDVDNILQRLSEKRKLVIDNWQRWSELITNSLDQSDEVHSNSLVGIPASLRIWAITKYLKEHPDSGLVFESEALRRKFVKPDQVIGEMVHKGLLSGGVLIKDGRILSVNMATGSTAVAGILTVKLLSYTMSVVKKLGQHSCSSIAAVGDQLVLVMMHHTSVDALLFIKKDKFKDAVEEWKAKVKLLEKSS